MEPDSPKEVIAMMQVAVRTIDRPMLRRVHEKLVRRTEACRLVEAHFENLL